MLITNNCNNKIKSLQNKINKCNNNINFNKIIIILKIGNNKIKIF